MERDSYTKDHTLSRKSEFKGYPIISDQITRDGLAVVWQELDRVLRQNIGGDIVEFGCYAGTTSLFIRRLLDIHHVSQTRAFHVYDSFEGLPEKSVQDQNAAGVDFLPGKLYVSKKEFLHQFHTASLQPPITHKAWFHDLTQHDVPEQLAFAFLDGDFYDSIMSSLQLVWPRMQAGSKVLVDDYERETLPGVAEAIRDFFHDRHVKNMRMQANIAIIDV